MSPGLSLSVASLLAAFAIKTALVFFVCLAVCSLIESPNLRLTAWLCFLAGSAGSWLWVGSVIFASASPHSIKGLSGPGVAAPTASLWHIPLGWAVPLGYFLLAIGFLYLFVLGSIFLLHVKKRLRLRWILGFSYDPGSEISQLFRQLAERFRARRARLLVLSGITSPATFGWFRPTVLLPEICQQMDESEVEDILQHELQHIRRGDSIWNAFALTSRALLFFHPAAWYAVKRIKFDRELACDRAVLAGIPERCVQYAESLVRFARLNEAQASQPWDLDFAVSHLTARVHSILGQKRRLPGWQRVVRYGFGMVFCAGVLRFALLLPVLFSYAVPSRASLIQPFSGASPSQPPLVSKRSRTRKARSAQPMTLSGVDSKPQTLAAEVERSGAVDPALGSPQVAGPGSRPGFVPSSILENGDPKLFHRGDQIPHRKAGNGERSIALVSSDTVGQTGKDGPHHEGALQQSIVWAGAISKQVADLKPER